MSRRERLECRAGCLNIPNYRQDISREPAHAQVLWCCSERSQKIIAFFTKLFSQNSRLPL